LIELAKQPEKQAKLREEITEFGATDPTWDQQISALPYLDSVVLETLRLHPPLAETTRQVCLHSEANTESKLFQASVDDVVPVGEVRQPRHIQAARNSRP
jgi:hypothetical protein